jgi:hypothetical protein
MKTFLKLFLLTLFISSCGSGGDKFVGKWKPIAQERQEGQLVIEKKGKVYEFYNTELPKNILSFDYDEDHDRLSFDTGQGIIDIKYTDNDHLIMSPRMPAGFDKPLEFEKAE